MRRVLTGTPAADTRSKYERGRDILAGIPGVKDFVFRNVPRPAVCRAQQSPGRAVFGSKPRVKPGDTVHPRP